MNKTIAILDYGLGNIMSLARAIESLDGKVIISSDQEKINQSDMLIIPGVGSFGKAMEELSKRNLLQTINKFIKSGRTVMGICLGMQILFESSEESEGISGLGILSGEVKKIPTSGLLKKRKIPHIGWNKIYHNKENDEWNNTILRGITKEDYFYFIHSYSCQPKEDVNIIAYCDYNDYKICAAINFENIIGLQFHPENSSIKGIKIFENLIR